MLRLIRHGESEANAGGVTSDFGAVALTERGRRQADAIASHFAEPPNLVGLSRYLRARLTAAPLIARYPEISVIDLDVHEFTYLASERCVDMNAVQRQPLVDEYWNRMDPDYYDGPGSESFCKFFERTDSFLNWASTQSGDCVVFTHEQFIRAVLLRTMYPYERDLAKMMRCFFGMRVGQPITNGAMVRLRCDNNLWWTSGVDSRHLSAFKTTP